MPRWFFAVNVCMLPVGCNKPTIESSPPGQPIPYAVNPTGPTGGVGPTGTTGDTGSCEPYSGPVVITAATVECLDEERVRFRVETQGVASTGFVFSQETANVEPHWADEHPLESRAHDEACGSWGEFALTLQTGVFADWAMGQSTVFRCDAPFGPPYHHAAPVMTYAFRVYDSSGSLADCLVAGESPDGLIDDQFNRVSDPQDPEEILLCRVGVLSE